MSGELFRKSFHLLAFYYAVLLYLTRDPLITWGSFLYVVSLDYARLVIPEYGRLYSLLERITGPFMKDRERSDLSDASKMTLGVVLSLTLFGGWALVGLAISIVGDALASLVGRTFGWGPLINGKTISGFLAFPLWSLVVAWAVGGSPLTFVAIGVLVGTLEILSLRWENTILGVWASALVYLVHPWA
ncbi:MAG: hypothetical protein GXO29_02200 [Thermotogae bacterium]|nr:hypothetical protein [Thermotogota bacterium]